MTRGPVRRAWARADPTRCPPWLTSDAMARRSDYKVHKIEEVSAAVSQICNHEPPPTVATIISICSSLNNFSVCSLPSLQAPLPSRRGHPPLHTVTNRHHCRHESSFDLGLFSPTLFCLIGRFTVQGNGRRKRSLSCLKKKSCFELDRFPSMIHGSGHRGGQANVAWHRVCLHGRCGHIAVDLAHAWL